MSDELGLEYAQLRAQHTPPNQHFASPEQNMRETSFILQNPTLL